MLSRERRPCCESLGLGLGYRLAYFLTSTINSRLAIVPNCTMVGIYATFLDVRIKIMLRRSLGRLKYSQ
jgi:hypothetical protein